MQTKLYTLYASFIHLYLSSPPQISKATYVIEVCLRFTWVFLFNYFSLNTLFLPNTYGIGTRQFPSYDTA